MKRMWLVLLTLCVFSCQKKEEPTRVTASPPAPQGQPDVSGECEQIRLSQDIVDNSNIIGGNKVLATDVDAKSTVMIISTERNTGNSFVCTATPITPRTLITAAHCLDRASKVTAVFYVDLSCESGFRFSRDAVRAVDFRWHPLYDSNSMNSNNPDIGLVHLAADIKPGYPIYKINNIPETLNSELLLYGYGITSSNGSDSTVLRKVRLSREEYSFEMKSIIIPNNGVRGICLGDSGGPGLVSSNGELQIATVNSFGYGPRNDVCGGRSSLILIHPFMSWVEQSLKGWGESINVVAPTPEPEPIPVPTPPDL